MNSRAIAAAVLIRVKDDGAYSNVILPHATKELSGADTAFVFSLVYGTLRRMRLVDDIIKQASGRSLDQLDPEVVAVLEVAVAELLTDTEGATYATVNESVEAVKDLGRKRAAPLVNGLLRSLIRDGMPDLPDDPARDLSVPDWVVTDLERDHGAEEALRVLRGLRIVSPQTPIRVRASAEPPSGSEMVPGIHGAYHLDARPKTDEGIVYADPASTAVGLALGVRPGETVLDMAAAPGGKTMQLCDQSDDGVIVAMDVHRRRLKSARRRLRRAGVAPHWFLADALQTPFRDESFDAVLLDAPCTGLGTLRRRPEIAMRLQLGAPERLSARQGRMLEEAWRITRPGGRVVYSVCTLFAAETIAVVDDYPARPPEDLPGRPWGKGLLLAPHITETDGMFIAVLDK